MGGVSASCGFFHSRDPIEIWETELDGPRGLKEYLNVPRSVAAVVSVGKATHHECATLYGVEAVYDILEIILVDSYNRHLYEKWMSKRS
jgi:hypothetical protein